MFVMDYVRNSPIPFGKLRVVDLFVDVFLRNKSKKRAAQLVHGDYRLCVDISFFLQRQFYFFGDYWLERELIALWKDYTVQANIVFDVGANLGIYSLAAASVNKTASIYAFEPTSEIVVALKDTLLKNQIQNVNVVAAAVMNAPGLVDLNSCSGGKANDGMNYVTRGDKIASMSTSRIPSVSLDEFCQEQGISVIDLIKIDVQGMEYEVLEGASGMLESGAIRTIFIELNWHQDGRGGVAEDVVNRLSELGYGFRAKETAWQLRQRGDWIYGCSDVIAEKGATGR